MWSDPTLCLHWATCPLLPPFLYIVRGEAGSSASADIFKSFFCYKYDFPMAVFLFPFLGDCTKSIGSKTVAPLRWGTLLVNQIREKTGFIIGADSCYNISLIRLIRSFIITANYILYSITQKNALVLHLYSFALYWFVFVGNTNSFW